MSRQSSGLKDIAAVFDNHRVRLDAVDRKLHEHDKAHAATYRELETLKNEIIILRDGISAYCDRVISRFEKAMKAMRIDADTD